jgi:anaerobic selenocysteine-containing dehydrogenase
VVGRLEPRLPGALRTDSGRIELAPPELVGEVPRLAAALDRTAGLRMIGRRDLRTNNSWMHNVAGLARGKDRSRLLVHPDDAAARQLQTGDRARLRGAHHEVVVEVEVDDAMMPGVVSLPHGWGHDHGDSRLSIAEGRPGVNANLLADHDTIDPLSGTSVVNGVDVELLGDRVP